LEVIHPASFSSEGVKYPDAQNFGALREKWDGLEKNQYIQNRVLKNMVVEFQDAI